MRWLWIIVIILVGFVGISLPALAQIISGGGSGGTAPIVSSVSITGGTTPQLLGNDLVIGSSGPAVAPAGPGIAGVVLRARRGTIPGTCQLTAAGGSAFGEVILIDNIPAGAKGC